MAFDVADLEAVRRHLALDRPVVIGHSYCSAVALLHALDHPHAVSGLVLVGAFAARRLPWHDSELPSLGEMIRPPGSTRLGALRAGKVHRTDPRTYAREWMRHYLLPQQVARIENVGLVPLDACDLPNEFPEKWIPDWLERIYPSLGDWDWRPRLAEPRRPGAARLGRDRPGTAGGGAGVALRARARRDARRAGRGPLAVLREPRRLLPGGGEVPGAVDRESRRALRFDPSGRPARPWSRSSPAPHEAPRAGACG